MKECPKCKRHTFDYDPRCKAWICLTISCNHFLNDKPIKPRVIIEIKAGALSAVYSEANIELILIDYDEFEGSPSSAVIIPDGLLEASVETKQLADDAVRRA